MKLKLRTVLIAGLMFIICLGLLIAFHGIFSMAHVNGEISNTIHVRAQSTSRIHDIHTNLLRIEYILTAKEQAKSFGDRYTTITEYARAIDTEVDGLKNEIKEGSARNILDKFVFEWSLIFKALESEEANLANLDAGGTKSGLLEQIHTLEDILGKLLEREKQVFNESITYTNSYTSRARIMMILILVVCLIVAFAIIGFMLNIIQVKIGGDPDQVAMVAQRVAVGDLQIEFEGQLKGVYATIKQIVESMEKVEYQANRVAQGDYSTEIIPRSSNDSLSVALIQMNENLRNSAKATSEQNWLKDGLNKLAMEISGNLTQQELADRAISFIGRYMDAGKAVLYSYLKDADKLSLLGSFAYTERELLSNSYSLGEGVVGQVALERKPIMLIGKGVEESRILTGTGIQSPLCTYTYPLIYEKELYGVLEIASIEQIDKVKMDFLDQSGAILATYLYAVQQKQQIQALLEQARNSQTVAEEKASALQEMNAQLEEQQQKIQQQSEILQRANAQMEEQQQQLQQQTEELQQSNAQMEEQQQQLQQQQEELRQTNETLVLAKIDLDKRAQDLEQSNKYKSEFLANMSHELRTPLNSILMLSKLLARNGKGNLEAEDIKKADVIHTAGEELLRLINDILDLSKIEAGKNMLHLRKVNPAAWVKELKDYFDQIVQNKGLEFEIKNSITRDMVTDPDKVSQILRNFLSNAAKFTHQGKISLNFYLSKHPTRPVALEISDTGVGIEPAQQKKIFMAFHQVDSSISREYGGTGLGLTIASRLTALLCGEICLNSEPGKGSTFTLNLPFELDENCLEGGLNDNPPDPSAGYVSLGRDERLTDEKSDYLDDRSSIAANQPCFLIVEADRMFASVIGNVIHSMGFKFVLAVNADEAYQMAQSYLPQGIILDLDLPGSDGVELLKRFKGHSNLKSTPIQVISSSESGKVELDEASLDLLQKFVEEAKIKDAVSGMLGVDPLKKKKLLIVEDNDIQRVVLQEYIADENTEVCGVGTQTEAMDELSKGDYDAVIVDLGLKQGNGLSLCKAIRKKQLKLPLIVYTGKDLSEAEEKQIKQYADRIIIKTINSVQRLIDELGLFLNRVKHEELRLEPKLPAMDIVNQNLEGKRILIVDDDIKNVFVLCSALEERGMIVQDAQNGKDAIEMMRQNYYDLILMDIMMPVMDGFTALKLIREDDDLKHTPIIALTAKALKEDRAKCIEAGANDYIAKPIEYEGLFNLIQAWITKRV